MPATDKTTLGNIIYVVMSASKRNDVHAQRKSGFASDTLNAASIAARPAPKTAARAATVSASRKSDFFTKLVFICIK